MASTTFTDNSTIIYAAWLNDVNTAAYTTIPAIIAGTQVVGNATAAVTATTATNATNVTGTIASGATATTQSAGDNSTKVSTTAYVDGAVASVAPVASVLGAFRNLVASATGTGPTTTVTADELILENPSNEYKTVRAVSLSVSGASSGVANGLDTGALATSTWYSLWVINNGTTTAGLLSTSATAPTMPTGYTNAYKARVGWIRTDSTGNKYPLAFKQYGRKARYVVAAGTNVTALPVVGAGGVGTAWPTALATANFFPPGTASAVFNLVSSLAASTMTFGPNSTTEMVSLGNSYSSGAYQSQVAEFILESANVYWSFTGTSGSGIVAAYGWEDSL